MNEWPEPVVPTPRDDAIERTERAAYRWWASGVLMMVDALRRTPAPFAVGLLVFGAVCLITGVVVLARSGAQLMDTGNPED